MNIGRAVGGMVTAIAIAGIFMVVAPKVSGINQRVRQRIATRLPPPSRAGRLPGTHMT